jgi:hypothetical protein
MFHLDARINLDKVYVSLGINDKFNGSYVPVFNRARTFLSKREEKEILL